VAARARRHAGRTAVFALVAAASFLTENAWAAELPAAMTALLDGAEADTEVVRFADDREGGLLLATRVAAEPARLVALLAEPATYQRAVPAFVKAEVQKGAQDTVPNQRAGTAAQLIAWELEVPLWNFAGTLWLRPHRGGAHLELVDGDLAPGRLSIDVIPPARPGGRTTLALSGTVAMEKANFVTRRLAARDPLAATAMRATALYVLLRALALDAVRTGSLPSPRRRPTVPIPVPTTPAGPLPPASIWSNWATDPGGPRGHTAYGVVSSRATGRLDRVSVALPLPLSQVRAAEGAQAALIKPEAWRTLPGWRDIEVTGTPQAPIWEVDSGMPFVDFDAAWSILAPQPFRAQARGGDWQGPTIAVDLIPHAGSQSVIVYTTAPLINRTGYLPRRLIEAEPLLEQGLALGLAFVNARSLVRGLTSLVNR
jgi:hypothetical protein